METVKTYLVRKPSDIQEVLSMTVQHPEYAELVQIIETLELSKEQYHAICKYPLRDYAFLKGKGGYIDGWRTVVKLICKGKQDLFVDPSGSSYCRYLGVKVEE